MTSLEQINECERCANTGIANVPNGPDDFDAEYCDCPLGRAMAAKENSYED